MDSSLPLLLGSSRAAPLVKVHPPEKKDLGTVSRGSKLRSDVSSHCMPGNHSENPLSDAFPEGACAWKNRKVSAYAFLWAPNMRFFGGWRTESQTMPASC